MAVYTRYMPDVESVHSPLLPHEPAEDNSWYADYLDEVEAAYIMPFYLAPVVAAPRRPAMHIHRRMAGILALVLLIVLPLFLRFRPVAELAAAPVVAAPVPAPPSDAAAEALHVAPGPALGVLSPIFTDEVMHWEPQIVAWAEQFGVAPDMVAIIMQIESCGDPLAVSGAGAQGLFQVMPFHFAAGEDSLDPDTNARRGIAYFVERLNQTNGDVGRAYAGYNGGHVAAASSWDHWAAETQRYYRWSTGLYQDIQQGLTTSPTLDSWLAAGGASLCRQAAGRLGLNS